MSGKGVEDEIILAADLNHVDISCTSPAPRLLEENKALKLSFPISHLKKKYNGKDAEIDKEKVGFNRALLINGFRRLETFEQKREIDALSAASQKRFKDVDTRQAADYFQPTILMSALCSLSIMKEKWGKKQAKIKKKI